MPFFGLRLDVFFFYLCPRVSSSMRDSLCLAIHADALCLHHDPKKKQCFLHKVLYQRHCWVAKMPASTKIVWKLNIFITGLAAGLCGCCVYAMYVVRLLCLCGYVWPVARWQCTVGVPATHNKLCRWSGIHEWNANGKRIFMLTLECYAPHTGPFHSTWSKLIADRKSSIVLKIEILFKATNHEKQ